MNLHVIVVDAADLGRGFTGADWFFDENGDLQVRVSKLKTWKREFCLALHEIVEAVLCHANGVTTEAVDDFDRWYEATHTSDLNAGDDSQAPYRREHCFATAVERMVAAELDVPWSEYDTELANIPLHVHAVEKLKKFGLIGNGKQVG